jgi:hypothetical protein
MPVAKEHLSCNAAHHTLSPDNLSEIMDEERQKALTGDPASAEPPDDLDSYERDLEEPSTRAQILDHVLEENTTNVERPGDPLLIDSEEIGVLKLQVSITKRLPTHASDLESQRLATMLTSGQAIFRPACESQRQDG